MALSSPSDNVGYTPSILPTTNWSELASSYIDTSFLNYNMDSSNAAMRKAMEPRDKLYESLTGSPISSLWYKESPFEGSPDVGFHRTTGSYKDAIVDKEILKLREKDARFNDVKTSSELVDDAKRIAQEQFLRTRELEERYEGSTFTASLAGGMVAAFKDPIQLLTLPFGASFGSGKSLLGFMVKEAAISMGVETAIQPYVFDWQKELGQKYGFGDVALNILAAGAGGAVLSGGIAGTARLSSKLYNLAKNSPNRQSAHAAEEIADAVRQREAIPSQDIQRHARNVEVTAEAFNAGRKLEADELDTRLIDQQDGIPAQAFAFLDPEAEFKVTTRITDKAGNVISEKSAPKKVKDMTASQLRKAVETRILPDIKKDLDEAIQMMERDLNRVPLADIDQINLKINQSKKSFDERISLLNSEIKSLKDKLSKTRGRDKEAKARLSSEIASKEKTIREESGIHVGRIDSLTQKRNRAYGQLDKLETLNDFRKARADILKGRIPEGDSSPAREIRAVLDRVTEGAKRSKKRVVSPAPEPMPKIDDVISRLDESESLHESRLPMIMQEMEEYADFTFDLDGKTVSVRSILDDTAGEDDLLVVSSCGKGAGK